MLHVSVCPGTVWCVLTLDSRFFFILGHVTESRAIEYFGVCYGAWDQGALVLLCCSLKAVLIQELVLLSEPPLPNDS